MVIKPAPIIAVTVTTVVRHCRANWPDASLPGYRIARAGVTRGFRYEGPIFVGWT